MSFVRHKLPASRQPFSSLLSKCISLGLLVFTACSLWTVFWFISTNPYSRGQSSRLTDQMGPSASISKDTSRSSIINNHTRQNNYSLAFPVTKNLSYFREVSSSHLDDRLRERYMINFTLPTGTNKSKVILFYNPPSWYSNAKSVCTKIVEKCPITNCQCSDSKNDLIKADAVIVNAVEIPTPNPPLKLSNQVWIFFGLESPYYYYSPHYKSDKWRKVFNWTMTYRLDSDIPTTYGSLIQREASDKNFTNIAARKKKSAVWLVSNCKTPSRRELYVRELRKHYAVDIIGKCENKKRILLNLTELLNQYRFYLAFENSLCLDYITEKLFKTYAVDVNIVPVVRGGADYGSVIPTGTYINTASYSSPKQLAEYLKYLEKNTTAYEEFLYKKSQYVSVERIYHGFCKICVNLHNLNSTSNHYKDISKWLHQDTCHAPHDY